MLRLVPLTALLFLLTGCFAPSSTTSLQQHTADATAAAKRDAGAIARGIAEGLARKGPLDLNTATAKQLGTLPGITPELAAAIIAGRPYRATRDLTKKKVLSKDAFDRIRNQILVQ